MSLSVKNMKLPWIYSSMIKLIKLDSLVAYWKIEHSPMLKYQESNVPPITKRYRLIKGHGINEPIAFDGLIIAMWDKWYLCGALIKVNECSSQRPSIPWQCIELQSLYLTVWLQFCNALWSFCFTTYSCTTETAMSCHSWQPCRERARPTRCVMC